MLGTSSLRVLGRRDMAEAHALLDRDPVTNVFVSSLLSAAGDDPTQVSAELWGHVVRGRLEALCFSGANLVPAQAGPEAVRAFADLARRQGRRCSSIVGPADAVSLLWQLLEPAWGPARDVRPRQPLCVADGPPAVPPDPQVRPVRLDELDLLVPASVQMFTEEVGVSPLGRDGGALYRARVRDLVTSGRAFARIEDGRIVFKAEIGSVSAAVCQAQGVWVTPERRGEGLSVGGMAAVVEQARATIAPVVSLYVNDYNAAARAAYATVGFREVGTLMSVLF